MIHSLWIIPIFFAGTLFGWWVRHKAEAERELYRTFSRENLKRELEKHKN